MGWYAATFTAAVGDIPSLPKHCWGSPCFPTFQPQQLFLGVMPTSHTKAVHVWTEGGLSWEGVSRSRPRLTISFWTGGQRRTGWNFHSVEGYLQLALGSCPILQCKGTKLWVNPSSQENTSSIFSQDRKFWEGTLHFGTCPDVVT